MASPRAARIGPELEVKGLRDFVRDVRRTSPELARGLRASNKALAESVAEGARAKVGPSLGRSSGTRNRQRPGSHGLSATRDSIRAKATEREASILIGGPRAKAALGHEFGSLRYPQFQAWRGNKSGAGYYLWPTIRQELGRVERDYARMIDEVAAAAFPDR
jgi:hypothetical protein